MPAESVAAARERPTGVLGIAAVLSLSILLLYLGRYPLRHANLPAGFDAPWYVWRAQYVGAAGIGPLGTASRPGHAVLSALLGSVTGLSQLRMAVVFSQLLPALLALVVGAFAYVAIRPDRAAWAITVALTGAVLGASRLVGENLANLVNLALEVGALLILVSARDRRRGAWAAGLLLVAAALAHWTFAAVCGATLVVAIALGAVALRRSDPSGRTLIAREARSLAAVGLGAALGVAFVVVVILRAPFASFELEPNPLESTAKLITDLARLWPAALIALLGAGVVLTAVRAERGGAGSSLSRRLLAAWSIVAAAGLLLGLIGTKVSHLSSLPPHRFLALLIAFPGMVCAGAAVRWASGRAGSRAGRVAGAAVVVGACGILLVPTVIRWYRYPVLLSADALQQARTAAGYVAQLPADEPFIVVVGPDGNAGRYTTVLRERTVRMELPADRQAGLRIFPGDPADLLAGRRTITGDPRTDQVTLPYWRAVASVLARQPPILLVRALGPAEFDEGARLGSQAIAPGVTLLRGPPPTIPVVPAATPDGSVTLLTVLGAFALLVLLWASGVGWTRAVLGRAAPPEVWVSLTPVVGMGALLLGGFVATEVGLRLQGVAGPAVFAMVTLSGWAAAWRNARRPLTGKA